MTNADSPKANTLLSGRADWHLRANSFVIAYLAAALVSGFFQKSAEGGEPAWLTVHLLLLGATTNAIVTWSDHFVSALLWARAQRRARQMRIIVLLNTGVLGVLVSISYHSHLLTLFFGLLIGGVISFYLYGIASLVKSSLNKKFTGVVAFYQFAGISILIGIVLGVIDAFKKDGDPWQPRIALAHLHANLLGWVGLTIIGTLVTLWPTVLRTQMHPKAISSAVLGLKFLLVGVSSSIIGPLINSQWVLSFGVLIYLAGTVITLSPAALLMRRRLPDRPSSWMMLIGSAGLVILLICDIIITLVQKNPEKILSAFESRLFLIFTLWLLPILLGALTYLLPVVLGRGPASNRKLEKTIGFGWKWRLFLLPISSILLVLHGGMSEVGRVLLALALGLFLILALVTMRQARALSTS